MSQALIEFVSDDELTSDRGWTEVAAAAVNTLPQDQAGRYFNLAAGVVVVLCGLRVINNLGGRTFDMLDRSLKPILKMVKDGRARLELHLTHVAVVPNNEQ